MNLPRATGSYGFKVTESRYWHFRFCVDPSPGTEQASQMGLHPLKPSLPVRGIEEDYVKLLGRRFKKFYRVICNNPDISCLECRLRFTQMGLHFGRLLYHHHHVRAP